MTLNDAPRYKFCTKCGQTHPIELFSFNRWTKDGVTNYCTKCYLTAAAVYRKKVIDRKVAAWKAKLGVKVAS